MLKVKALKFTHDCVAQYFRDGSTFERCMQDFRSGQVDPRRNLKPLKVYHGPGRGYKLKPTMPMTSIHLSVIVTVRLGAPKPVLVAREPVLAGPCSAEGQSGGHNACFRGGRDCEG